MRSVIWKFSAELERAVEQGELLADATRVPARAD